MDEEIMIITLNGRVRPKKNSRINTSNGRSFPSKEYTEWHNDAISQLAGIERTSLKYPLYIGMVFTFGDKRKNDLDNRMTSIMDLLVDSGIIEDDSYLNIDRVSACAKYEKDKWETMIMIRGNESI